MKMRSFLVASLLLLASISSKALDANITYATFKGIEQDNFIEVYIQVIGRSVEFVKTDQGYEAAVEITLMFKQDETIAVVDKYVLKNPPQQHNLSSEVSLVDMKRMKLPNGEYTLEVQLKDLNRPGNDRSYATHVSMMYDRETACISDIQLLENFSPSDENNKYVKNGYFLKPYTYTVYPSFVDKMTFYAEVYNSDTGLGEDYLVRFYLREAGADDQPLAGHLGIRKQAPKTVNTVMMQMDISEVPTGDYELVVEVRDQKNQLTCRKALNIKRSNPQHFDFAEYTSQKTENSFVAELNDEDVSTALAALNPIIDDIALPLMNEIQKSESLEDDRQFVLHFWSKFNELEPVILYEKYMERVAFVNKNFTTAFDKGYESDRGYIFLKYGAPNDIFERRSEPVAAPYEIWKYHNLNANQRYASFIFYNPSLAPDNFVLLHSNVRGEIQDPQWERKLYKNQIPGTPKEEWDGANISEHFGGGEARAYFDQY